MARHGVSCILVAGWLFWSGCPDECEVACGKLEYCGLLADDSRTRCNDSCEDAGDEGPAQCADCLDNTACGEIGGGTCKEACAETIEIREP